MKPWERYWFALQTPAVEHFGEYGGQWWVYSADSAEERERGTASPLFGYRGPPLSEEEARFAAEAPDLYRALDALATAVRTGAETGDALLGAERALNAARGES